MLDRVDCSNEEFYRFTDIDIYVMSDGNPRWIDGILLDRGRNHVQPDHRSAPYTNSRQRTRSKPCCVIS